MSGSQNSSIIRFIIKGIVLSDELQTIPIVFAMNRKLSIFLLNNFLQLNVTSDNADYQFTCR